MERVLSVFCNESGDFGRLEPHSPYYLLTLVMHDQSCPVSDQVLRLESSLSLEPVDASDAVHTAPLIRREGPYESLDLRTRRRIFSHLEHFARSCDIRAWTAVVPKREFGDGDALAERIARELGLFIRENLGYFHSFDRVIIYYDRGQRRISSALRLIFSSSITGVEFRTVRPQDYRLFQVADLVCTLELVARKARDGSLSASELSFFGRERDLRKNHLKAIRRKLME